MQNTNQLQTYYTKPGTSVSASTVITPTAQPQNGNKMKPKRVFAVVGLVLFLIVAIMGVLIAQKQITKPGQDVTPVAPTAPESQPSASTYKPNSCATVFTVPAPIAECTKKVALTDFTSAGGKSIPEGSSFNVGDEFVFSLTVNQPAAGIAQNVKLIDTLPNSLIFVSGQTSPLYSISSNGQIVTATIPQIGSKSSVQVEFKVKVVATNLGKNTNTATVQNLAVDVPANNCTYDFMTIEGITECVGKSLYDLQGKLISNGGTITRGQQYEYRVTAKATGRSLGEVKVHDILPEDLKYIKPAAGSEQYITNDPSSGLLIANFGVLEDEEKTLGFIMEVPKDIEPTQFTNKAFVYAFPPNSRQPEPPANADECSVTHAILPVGSAECVSKEAYTNFNGTKIAANSEIKPGDEFVYKITLTAEETTSGTVTIVDTLNEDLTFIQDSGNTSGLSYNATTREVSLNVGVMQPGQTKVVQFKVQLSANPKNKTITNVATITTNSDTQHTCEIPLKVKQQTYSCNSACQTNENCSTIGSNYLCYTTTTGNYCRLASNPTSVSCSTATPTPTPSIGCNDSCATNADCSNSAHICAQTATGSRCRLATYVSSPDCVIPATATPTPAPGCNDVCAQNADCSNSNHVCVSTSDGNTRCRLANYPDSTSCTATVAQQPELPEELPQSGPEEWLNWLKAGLVTLGIGTALFLLL